MSNSIIKSFASKTTYTQEEVEKMWSKAKKLAEKEGKGENFAYIVGILKKMLGLKESLFLKALESSMFKYISGFNTQTGKFFAYEKSGVDKYRLNMFYIPKMHKKYKNFKSEKKNFEGREVIFFYDGDKLMSIWDEDTYALYYDEKI